MSLSNLKPKGFTMVETMIVTIIACSLMIAIHAFFSHAVRSTMKGQDNLDSIRAASQIFSSLRKDLLQFNTLSTDGAITTVALGNQDLPGTATCSSIIELRRPKETITYSLIDDSGKKFVERISQDLTTGDTNQKLFGVPRMKEFKIMYITTPNQINSITRNVGQIMVNLVIDSDDKRFASKEINLTSVFFSEKLTDSDWNFLSF
ncbi:MAG: PulJ/GspJ family protein [Candidatus Rifleibacteriota bacterium]